ncbi:MAG TPA: EcsC family protein [Terriglobales bacterium]|nr:EcsC family protein [Terriglobales bacterium]
MSEPAEKHGLTRRAVEAIARRALKHAFKTIAVDPQEYLFQLRAAHDLPVQSYQGMFTLPVDVLDDLARQTIRAGMKMAAAEGAGMGLGGLFTLLPDLSILSAITMRTIQKLSLIYGFEFNTDDEQAELWIAAASAAGVDISRELIEKQLVKRFIPRVAQRIAAQASAEVAEKWVGRLVPVASSVIGAGLNYYFVRGWGRRAMAHFRERHLQTRHKMLAEQGTS